MTTTPGPGWYPDPAEGTEDGGFRWWDGNNWTDHVADHAYAPAPDIIDHTVPGRQRSRMVRVVSWTLIVALVLTTAAGALMLLWAGPETSSGRQLDEGATPAGGQLDERARRASIGPVTMDLPGAPYKVAGTHAVPGILDAAFVAEATTHSRTSSQDSSWGAMVCLASVHQRFTTDFDLDKDSVATLHRLAERLYGTGPTRIRHLRVDDHAVDGHGGVRITAQIHYKIAGLPNRYDEVTAQLVRLDDGSVVAGFSSIPNDASEQIRQLAAQSLASLRID
ncbi:MAG: DUF2510 domain-containing protein [Microlunatus sp.]